ncbi:MAG: hypothetical protein JWP44_3707, partial [Mucilaginibacter sp.]|nr:hypothetical protein [Mucilaginibacter sp.]
MIPFKRIDHILITIPEGKKDEARAFYAGMLNLIEIPGNHPKGAIWFEIGDIQLHVREEAGGNYSVWHHAFEVSDLAITVQFFKSIFIVIRYSSEIDGR